MNIHILQHVPFEDVGSMASWFEKANASLSYTRFHQNPALPELNSLHLVIAMGGPMSVNDETTFPWLRAEKEFIRNAVESNIPVLGICLGAQLIASALGARVYKNTHKEIGWFPVEATPDTADTFRFPETCTAFHWHGETFDLPAGAIRLAKNSACENQAFQIGRSVIGLQFHLEATSSSIRTLVDNCRNELVPGDHIQNVEKLLNPGSEAYPKINTIMNDVLSYLLEAKNYT